MTVKLSAQTACALGLTLLVACGGNTDGGSAPACAQRVTFEGRTYGARPEEAATAGSRLPSARILGCSDGGEGPYDEVPTFEVEGVSSDLAIIIDDPATGRTFYELQAPTD